MFTTVLNNRDFNYLARMVAGIPTTRKSIDEGYFVVDSKDMMYHVKMIKGEPYVRKIDVPEGLTFKHISCVDFSDKKYYAYLVSEDNGLNILTQDIYEFIRRTKLKMRKNILDLAISAVTGIYGFIAVNFFRNKFFDL